MWMDRAEKNPETDLNKYGQWFFFKYKGKSMDKKLYSQQMMLKQLEI